MDTTRWKSVLVPREVYDELKNDAQREGRTISGQLRILLKKRDTEPAEPVEIVQKKITNRQLGNLLRDSNLSMRHRSIIEKLVYDEMTYVSIAEELGVTRQRVHQIVSDLVANRSSSVERMNTLTYPDHIKNFLIKNDYYDEEIEKFLTNITCSNLEADSDFSVFYGLQLVEVFENSIYAQKLERLKQAVEQYAKQVSPST